MVVDDGNAVGRPSRGLLARRRHRLSRRHDRRDDGLQHTAEQRTGGAGARESRGGEVLVELSLDVDRVESRAHDCTAGISSALHVGVPAA